MIYQAVQFQPIVFFAPRIASRLSGRFCGGKAQIDPLPDQKGGLESRRACIYD